MFSAPPMPPQDDVAAVSAHSGLTEVLVKPKETRYLLNCNNLGQNSRITNALVKLIQDPNQDDLLTSVWGQPWVCCVSSTHSTRSTHTWPSTGATTAGQHKTLNFIWRSYRGHCCCLLSGAWPFCKRYCRLRGHFNDDANKGSAVSPRWQKCWSAADNAASTLSVRFKAVSLLCTWAAQCVGMLHSGTHPKTRLSFSLGVKVAPKPPLINCFSGVD